MTTPFVMVIFGATGDLARRKLIPSLFSLFKQKLLPQEFFIIGFSRRNINDDEFRNLFTAVAEDRQWKEFSQHLTYQKGVFEEEDGYNELIKKINGLDKKIGACITRFFYLATPPDHYEVILNYLKTTKLSEARIVIEKPFGKDLGNARELDKKLSEIFEEKQIFRVDHYLSKETVQNILTFRFANGIFEPVWNKNYIDHVQITFAESKGIEGRGAFFDGVGMLRDVGQNHLMQLIAAVAMEQPKSFTKEGVRDARASAISAIKRRELDDIVRGQYQGYQKEKDVQKNSNTETFTALKLFVDTQRFAGVPFYIRAGKKMPKNTVEISIVFIQTCHILFKEYGCPEEGNRLTIRIQPNEGIGLHVVAKKPGSKLSLGTVDMKFSYKDEFGGDGKDAYEKVLLDIFSGDQMLFNRSDELESSWDFITKILNEWSSQKSEVRSYQSGTWGPKEADELIKKDGKKWL